MINTLTKDPSIPTHVAMSVTCAASGTAVTAGVCQHCGFGYSVQGMEMDNQARLTFNVAVLSAKPPTDS